MARKPKPDSVEVIDKRSNERASVFAKRTPLEENAVLAISNAIIAGTWKTGVSVAAYAKAWGVSEAKVYEWARMARVSMRLALDKTAVVGMFNEASLCMFRLMHKCEDEGDTRGAMFASATIMKTAAALLKDADSLGADEGEQLKGKAAFDALIQSGWSPPNTLRGLPAPSEYLESIPVNSGVSEASNEDNEADDDNDE